jgi:hypothetical protein
MTFRTGENPINFRYRIYLKDELIATTSILKGALGFVRPFVEDPEYTGTYIVVKDTYSNDAVILSMEGGSEPKKSADILPFPTRT